MRRESSGHGSENLASLLSITWRPAGRDDGPSLSPENVAKHAGASRVSVILERFRDPLTVVVEDNGTGFDPTARMAQAGTRGLGLLGTRERVNLVHGSLLIDSAEGKGTTVRARVPLSS